MIQSSLFGGLVHFDCFPDLTLVLDDNNIIKVLTLNILTSGYDMLEGSKLLALVYQIYYRLLKINLNPKTISKPTAGKTLLIQSSTPDANIQVPKMVYWKDISLPNEWTLEYEVPPVKTIPDDCTLDYIQQYLDSNVKISFD